MQSSMSILNGMYRFFLLAQIEMCSKLSKMLMDFFSTIPSTCSGVRTVLKSVFVMKLNAHQPPVNVFVRPAIKVGNEAQ